MWKEKKNSFLPADCNVDLKDVGYDLFGVENQ